MKVLKFLGIQPIFSFRMKHAFFVCRFYGYFMFFLIHSISGIHEPHISRCENFRVKTVRGYHDCIMGNVCIDTQFIYICTTNTPWNYSILIKSKIFLSLGWFLEFLTPSIGQQTVRCEGQLQVRRCPLYRHLSHQQDVQRRTLCFP